MLSPILILSFLSNDLDIMISFKLLGVSFNFSKINWSNFLKFNSSLTPLNIIVSIELSIVTIDGFSRIEFILISGYNVFISSIIFLDSWIISDDIPLLLFS